MLVNDKNTGAVIYGRFPGHLNDANCYQRIPRIGRHLHRDLPQRACLLTDGGKGRSNCSYSICTQQEATFGKSCIAIISSEPQRTLLV